MENFLFFLNDIIKKLTYDAISDIKGELRGTKVRSGKKFRLFHMLLFVQKKQT